MIPVSSSLKDIQRGSLKIEIAKIRLNARSDGYLPGIKRLLRYRTGERGPGVKNTSTCVFCFMSYK
jgi:hypothetical protein